MRIATAGSRRSTRWKTLDVSWEWMLDKLRTVRCTGETAAEYARMSRDEQSERKDVGGFVGGALAGGRRTAAAVTERWLITLDADNSPGADDAEDFWCIYECAMAVYSTHSHTESSPRLRYVIPLSRAVGADEYQAIARMAAKYIGIESMDPTTYQPERLFYWPSAPDDAPTVFREFGGAPLDPDALLREYGAGEAWKDTALWPCSDREGAVQRRELKRAGEPADKPGMVGLFCRAYDIHEAIETFLSEIYTLCDTVGGQTRYTYLGGSSAGGVVTYGDKWSYSHHATDPTSGLLCNAFDLVRIHRFRDLDERQSGVTDVTKLRSYAAMCDLAASDERVRQTERAEREAQIAEDFGDLEGAGVANATVDIDCKEEYNAEWETKLNCNNKTGAPEPTIENAELILDNDPRLRGRIAVNRFTTRVVVRRALPWRAPDIVAGEDAWTDADEANLLAYFEKYWQISSESKILKALTVVQSRNAFHPVREYLDGLKWDGVERLDTMLIRWMGADDTIYVRAATRKWMTAGVARIYEPGRKFDAMLMLVGPQGVGKSKLAMSLARGKWFSDSLGSTDGKEAYEGLRGKWIIEFAELAATKKSEVESVKNFVSKQEDTYRPAYGKNTVTYPRQCIFYGTTNDKEFLRDPTGNRRFWPVSVKGIDNGRLAGLDAEVDQLWAEAKARYRAGESLWFDDPKLMAAAREQQEAYTEQDPLIGAIEEYLDTLLPDNWDSMGLAERRGWYHGGTETLAEGTVRRDRVSVREIQNECLSEDIGALARTNCASTRRVATILNNLRGWEKTETRVRIGPYGMQRLYVRIVNDK